MRWPLNSYTVTQTFNNPAGHEGIDLAAPMGADIFAPVTGVVIGDGEDAKYVGGKYVIVREDAAPRREFYMGHMDSNLVNAGQRVTEGQHIGEVGKTGKATGPHVHYHIRTFNYGALIDPELVHKSAQQGGDEVIQNNDSSYDRWKLKMRHLWGDDSAKRFTRDAFVRDYVGHTSDEMDDRLLHNPSAEARLRAGDVGALAIQGDWWNRLVAKPQASTSSEDIDKAVKEAQEALDAVNKLKK